MKKDKQPINFTMEDVAKKAGVSRATVSRVISGFSHVSPKKKQQVMKAVKELNYHPNIIAQNLVLRKTNTIALIIPDIKNTFFMEMAKGVEDGITEHGYSLLVGSTNFSKDKEEEIIRLLMAGKVDGIILTTSGSRLDKFNRIKSRQFPLVLLARKSQYISADLIETDNLIGTKQVVDHMLDEGFKRIAYISGSLDFNTGYDRYNGYLKALKEKGVEYLPEYFKSGDHSMESGYQAMKELIQMKPRPEAVFIANNMMAVGAMKFCREQRIKIPEDIALAAFESFGYFGDLVYPTVTTNWVDRHDMARTAAELILKRINMKNDYNPIEIIIKPVLEIGESTQRVKKNK